MDRERLSRLLEEPAKVAREDLADLKALTEQFPWFSGAHLLRAIGEHNSGDVLADETLKVSAAHIPSRAVLFDLQDISVEQAASQLKLVRTENDPEPRSERSEISTAQPAIEAGSSDHAPESSSEEVEVSGPIPAEASIDEQLGSQNLDPTLDLLQIDDPAEPKDQEKSEIEIVSAETGTDPTQAEENVPSTDPVKEELDRQILEAAIASAYDLTWQNEIPAPAVEPKKSFRRGSLSQHLSDHLDRPIEPPIVPSPAIDHVRSHASLSEERPTIQVRSKLKFTDWLSISDRSIENDPLTSKDQENGSLDPSKEPLASAGNKIATQHLDPGTLIDRFIEHETPPPSRKAEFFTPQQAAKKSLDDSAGLVSETLAKIYEKQGNLQKAIEAYHKLALKYPEKSTYFAALSRTLEEKLNS